MNPNDLIEWLETQTNELREKVEMSAVETETETETESELIEAEPVDQHKIVLGCGAWCFILGLSANGAGCQLDSGHEGQHLLEIVSQKAPRATFTVQWSLED